MPPLPIWPRMRYRSAITMPEGKRPSSKSEGWDETTRAGENLGAAAADIAEVAAEVSARLRETGTPQAAQNRLSAATSDAHETHLDICVDQYRSGGPPAVTVPQP